MLRENRVTQPLRASAPRLKRPLHIRWQLARAALGILLVAGLVAGAALYRSPALLPEAVDMARAIFQCIPHEPTAWNTTSPESKITKVRVMISPCCAGEISR